MIIEGEAEIDTLAIDPRRFGAYGTRPYTIAKNEEAYAHVFVLHYPDEERPAARPLRTAPSYDRLQRARRRVRPEIRLGTRELLRSRRRLHGTWGFRRGNWWPYVKAEAEAIRTNVGLIEAGAFAKYLATGPGVNDWAERLVANRLPQKDGRIQLTHALTKNGGVRSEFTILREGPDSLYIVGAGALEAYDWDYPDAHRCPPTARCSCRKSRRNMACSSSPGRTRATLLAPLVDRLDLGNAAFPWLTGKPATVGMAPVRLLRVNYVGELGWEIHHPIEYHNHIFDALQEAGKPLRHEARRHAGDELAAAREKLSRRGHRAVEGGDRVGERPRPLHPARQERRLRRPRRAASGRRHRARSRWKLVTLLIDGPDDADPWGVESLWSGDTVVGRATGGGFSVVFDKQIAMGFVGPEYAAEKTGCRSACSARNIRRAWWRTAHTIRRTRAPVPRLKYPRHRRGTAARRLGSAYWKRS